MNRNQTVKIIESLGYRIGPAVAHLGREKIYPEWKRGKYPDLMPIGSLNDNYVEVHYNSLPDLYESVKLGLTFRSQLKRNKVKFTLGKNSLEAALSAIDSNLSTMNGLKTELRKILRKEK